MHTLGVGVSKTGCSFFFERCSSSVVGDLAMLYAFARHRVALKIATVDQRRNVHAWQDTAGGSNYTVVRAKRCVVLATILLCMPAVVLPAM